MYIYQEKNPPQKGTLQDKPLLTVAVGFCGDRVWPILPGRHFHLHPHLQYPCPYGEPLLPGNRPGMPPPMNPHCA